MLFSLLCEELNFLIYKILNLTVTVAKTSSYVYLKGV